MKIFALEAENYDLQDALRLSESIPGEITENYVLNSDSRF